MVRGLMSHGRGVLGIVVASALCVSGAVSEVATARSSQEGAEAAVSGSFPVGVSLEGSIDERTGQLSVEREVAGLPGLIGVGGVSLGVVYSQGASSHDVHGLGAGWAWSGPRVDVDSVLGGVRVYVGLGELFEVDRSVRSGLKNYPAGDVFFSSEQGVVSDPRGAGEPIAFSYSLERAGVGTTYFNAEGDRVAHTDVFGNRVVFGWGSGHRLESVTDAAGNRIVVRTTSAGLEVVSPANVHGDVAVTRFEVSGSRLDAIVDPVGDRVAFAYDIAEGVSGAMTGISTPEGAVARVVYQALPDGVSAVESVNVRDSHSGETVVSRAFRAESERLASGWPVYGNASDLWASGDGAFVYRTSVSNGGMTVVSAFDARGVLVEKSVVVADAGAQVDRVREVFEYESGADGVPASFGKPVRVTKTFRDDHGGERTVVEETEFDDRGRPVRQTSADGMVTTRSFDDRVRAGARLSHGLVTREVVAGVDGLVSVTVNELNEQGTAVVASEAWVGSSVEGAELTRRVEKSTQSDGFVSLERVVVANPGEGPGEVVTRFERAVDEKTVTVARINAAGTSAEFSTQTIVDRSTGRVLRDTDAMGRGSESRRDVLGREVSRVDASGGVTSSVYGSGSVTVTGPDGVSRSEYVDAQGRVVKVTDNIDRGVPVSGFERVAQTRAYDDAHGMVTVRDAFGAETVKVSDVFGRTTEVRGSRVARLTEYDDVANETREGVAPVGGSLTGLSASKQIVTSMRDDAGRVVGRGTERADAVRVPDTTATFDGLGREVARVSDGLDVRRSLDAGGNARETVTRPMGAVDDTQTVRSVREFAGVSGQSTKKTLVGREGASRHGGERGFDAAGRVVWERDQAGALTEHSYAADGLRVASVNRTTGLTVTNTYDSVTRALVETAARSGDGGVEVRGFAYDPVTGKLAGVFDAADRAGSMVAYSYDAFGNVTEVRYPDGKSVQHTFDENGRKVASRDVVGNVTRFEYAQDGLMTRVVQEGEGVRTGVSYGYDEYGRLSSVIRDNGVVTEYTFTSNDEVASETTTVNGTRLFAGEYRYDERGNLLRVVQSFREDREQPQLTEETIEYRYDAFNRLVESARFSGEAMGEPVRVDSYSLTVSGDVAQHRSRNASGETVRDFEYNALGHLVSVVTDGVAVAQQYDERGNLVAGSDGSQFEYGVSSRVESEVESGDGVTRYDYWATGKRKSESHSDGEVSVAYWDADTLVNEVFSGASEHESAGAVAYLLGITRHARTVVGGESAYFVTDRHGSVVSTVDSSGDVQDLYRYSDYGVVQHDGEHTQGVDRNPFQYSGEFTSLYGRQLLGDRVYDPESARFMSEDSAELHNRYAYGNGNPITRVDPTGQTAESDQAWFDFASALGALAITAFFLFANAPVFTLFRAQRAFSRLDFYGGIAERQFTRRWALISGLVGAVDTVVAAGYVADAGSRLAGKPLFTPEESEEFGWASVGLTAGVVAVGARKAHVFYPAKRHFLTTARGEFEEQWANGISQLNTTLVWNGKAPSLDRLNIIARGWITAVRSKLPRWSGADETFKDDPFEALASKARDWDFDLRAVGSSADELLGELASKKITSLSLREGRNIDEFTPLTLGDDAPGADAF